MIKLNKINKSFGEELSGVHVLKNLSLDVNTGEFVAIMGKSVDSTVRLRKSILPP